MNKKNIVNITAFFTILAGGFFKSNGFIGADFLVLTGTVFLLISLVYMSQELQLISTPVLFNYAASMALLLHVLGATLTALHWAGGNSCIWLGMAMSVLAVVFFFIGKSDFTFPKQFAICTFLYLLLIVNLFGRWNFHL